jgi:hypothetical protein
LKERDVVERDFLIDRAFIKYLDNIFDFNHEQPPIDSCQGM